MATAQHASELKQQGALEAARDPNSRVSAQAAEQTVIDEAKKGGSAALQFDPDASPEEKRRQARSVRMLEVKGAAKRESTDSAAIACPAWVPS
jgi:hypothetical protein